MWLVQDKVPNRKTKDDYALPGRNHHTPQTTVIEDGRNVMLCLPLYSSIILLSFSINTEL